MSVVIFYSVCQHYDAEPNQIYVGGAIYFGLNCALASISAFFPTVIANIGFSAHPVTLYLTNLNGRFEANAVAQILTGDGSCIVLFFDYSNV